jgi:hypothetical protein
MNNKLFILTLVIIIISVSLTSAQTFKQDSVIDIITSCTNNGSYCSVGLCNITLFYPNNSIYLNNQEMTNQYSFFNYTITTNTLGSYSCNALCCDGAYCNINNCDFIITPSGTELTTPQSILYSIGLFLAVIIFFLTLYASVVTPFKNGRDEYGKIISINNLKWVKVGFIALTYFMLLFVVGLADGIFRNFLSVVGINMFFNWIYMILLSLMYPLFVVGIVLIFVIYIYDYVAKKKLRRKYYR